MPIKKSKNKHELLLNIVLIVALLAGTQWYAAHGLASGAPPPLNGQMLDGKTFNLTDFDGRSAVIYFWASWCGICGQMQSGMKQIAQTTPLISVAMQSGDAAEVVQYQAEHGFHPDTLLDESGSLSKTYGIKGVPAIFILDPQGRLRFATSGFTTTWGIRLRLWLAENF
ncbi:protein disulfide oxidoreductase [Candidatus Methylospira mobilis]|uniref:protein disulfide oxidoreductase n=1 Tax=Candidatus Methylospira mobilis TaxID=1808979 RepID=UPI0028E65ACB|nr:protein disulfide oxidoreductase [Candidatus Methylospira mobilis]WNV04990.1 protein disulfide oxidoreductase [Candidatus Methylospira mobilis]